MLDGARILVTGPTGMVATPVTLALAERNEVIGLARFGDPAARARLEAAGVTCIPVNLADGDLSGVPGDVDYVLNLAVVKSGRWEVDLRANAEAAGLLMAHCRSATAFLHCSSTGIYQHAGSHLLAETDPLGDNHRVIMPTYSIAKIAAEAVVRTVCREHGVPTTIARLNVPYGDHGGWPAFHLEMLLAGQPIPVHPDRPNLFNPIHTDDIIATIPGLLAAASVPATIVNWGGAEQVSLEEWVAYLADLAGVDLDPLVVETDQTIGGVTVDLTRMHELVGTTSVGWRDGFRRMAAALHPELPGLADTADR
ncbi:MAG: NAD(P)-dependent oxidoreductase [Acidimicrobiales bacterium]